MSSEVFEKVPSIEEIAREVSNLRSTITQAVDEGVRTAINTYEQGRQAAAEAVSNTEDAVRENPLGAIGAAFGAGLITGILGAWMVFRGR